MKLSRLHYEVEIDEYLPQLEQVLLNFSLLAAGQIKSGEISDELLNDLATLNLLKSDLIDLKKDLVQEPDECHQCKAKNERIHDLQKSIDILEEIKSVQKTKIAELERMLEQTGNQPDPAKMKVSK